MRKVRIKGTDIYLKCYDVCLTYPTGLNCEYLNGPRKGKEITISGDCVVEEYVEDIPQVINTGENNKNRNDFLKSIVDVSYNGSFNWINENMVLVEIKDYDTMNRLFKNKSLWAIAYSTTYWKEYVEKNNSKQYVFIDFTKNNLDPESMIAFTYNPKDRVITYAFNRQNESLARIDSSADLELRKFMYEKNIEIKDYIG